MLSNHFILCCPLLLLPSIFPRIRVFFQWASSSYPVAKVLELQHLSFQWIFRVDFLQYWFVWSSLCPRNSQESSPAPQFKSINFSVLSQASLVAQLGKNLPAMQETWVQSLCQKDPLEKGMGTSHSRILSWRIPWTEEPGRLQIMGLQRVRHDWVTKYTCTLAGKSLRRLCSKSTYPYLFLKKWLIAILSGMGSINLNSIFLKWESQSP